VIPVGVESGWHTHPGEEVGYLLAGTIQMMIKDRETLLLHAGEGFLIPPDTPHNVARASHRSRSRPTTWPRGIRVRLGAERQRPGHRGYRAAQADPRSGYRHTVIGLANLVELADGGRTAECYSCGRELVSRGYFTRRCMYA